MDNARPSSDLAACRARRPARAPSPACTALESFARASVSSVIPIQAYELLQGQAVGLGPLHAGVADRPVGHTAHADPDRPLCAALGLHGRRGRADRRRRLLSTHSLPGQVAGMLARSFGAGALSITLNLYIMDHIRKTEFINSESLRMAWSTFGWTLGPTIGVLLYSHFGLVAAHGFSALFSVVLLALFWYYRLGDNPLIRPGKTGACQSARQYRPLRQPAAAEARLGDRLRPLVLLDDILHLRADPDGGDRRGHARRRPAGFGRQRAAVHGALLGQGAEALRRARHHRLRLPGDDRDAAACRRGRRGYPLWSAGVPARLARCSPSRSTRSARPPICARCARTSGRR